MLFKTTFLSTDLREILSLRTLPESFEAMLIPLLSLGESLTDLSRDMMRQEANHT